MTVLAIVDTALLAIAIVYIVALLRSHADILRRLSLLEEAGVASPVASASPSPSRSPHVQAADVSGVTLTGDPVRLEVTDGAGPTLLAFLTSGCASCRPFWEDLGDAGAVAALGARVVIVAHDADRESVSRLRELAPPGVELIMASDAWRDYDVPSSPHFVLLDGAIAGRGAAVSWQQLVAIVSDARADAAANALRVRTTGERAARAERALENAGITAGHPSLYPSSEDPR